jgi:hypothetical protein
MSSVAKKQSLKHQGLRTFGEYADMYVGVVLRKYVRFRRIDVVFDRYRTQSIKSGTRKKKNQNPYMYSQLEE